MAEEVAQRGRPHCSVERTNLVYASWSSVTINNVTFTPYFSLEDKAYNHCFQVT